MPEQRQQNSILDYINAAKGYKNIFETGKNLYDGASSLLGAGQTATPGYGATAPGIMDTWSGVNSAGAGASAIGGLGFGSLMAFALTKIMGAAFSENPRITFTGADPKYHMNGGEYKEFVEKSPTYGSSKYDYKINVRDTGQNSEIEKALVQELDAMFDQMAASGVPVNDLLQRNKDFAFGGRLDKGYTTEQLIADMDAHFAPDVEAYKAGETPPERRIVVKPMATGESHGRDNADMGNVNVPYWVTIDGSTNTAGGGSVATTPEQTILKSDFGDTGETSEGSPGGTNYQYDMDDPQIFTDYVNSFYDQALKEYQNQAGQFADNTKEYSDKSQGLLGQGQGYLDTLMGEVERNNTRNLPTVSRMAGGQRVDWVPRPNRDAALQDTNSAFGLMDRQGQFIDTSLNEAKTNYGNQQVLAAAGNPTLNYLDKLRELANTEQVRQASDKGLSLNQQQLLQNQQQFDSQQRANQPGMLDYAMGVGTLASGVGNLLKGWNSGDAGSWLEGLLS